MKLYFLMTIRMVNKIVFTLICTRRNPYQTFVLQLKTFFERHSIISASIGPLRTHLNRTRSVNVENSWSKTIREHRFWPLSFVLYRKTRHFKRHTAHRQNTKSFLLAAKRRTRRSHHLRRCRFVSVANFFVFLNAVHCIFSHVSCEFVIQLQLKKMRVYRTTVI